MFDDMEAFCAYVVLIYATVGAALLLVAVAVAPVIAIYYLAKGIFG